ncbi:hypothetical protein Pint_10682 [Pistacia integerrima]|uniref:Uncharacterized protein n=1 Tax=Pistacia integerrima TaxID=434235 RepID=A0ACC0XKC0_9ROSI|nr:hypothetical protein Pint_10682 [Pistacia integerrima]
MVEEEVRRELMMEREMAMHREAKMGLSIEERLTMRLDSRFSFMHQFNNRWLQDRLAFPGNRSLGLGMEVLPPVFPQLGDAMTDENKTALEVDKKDKLIILALKLVRSNNSLVECFLSLLTACFMRRDVVLGPVIGSVPSTEMDEGDHGNLDRIGHLFADLITWRDVAKSSLWFGLGCLCFLSSCFTKGISKSFHFHDISIFSAISQLGLLFLGASFFSNSILQRNNDEKKREFKVKEEDILRFGRLILPATNLAISKTRELFSGEPSKILKVVPFLLLGAEYGHIITMLRLFDLGMITTILIPIS